jgi:hypothetical protein
MVNLSVTALTLRFLGQLMASHLGQFEVRCSWGVVQLPLLIHSHDRRMHLAMASSEVPDYLPATWVDSREKRPIGPRLDLTVEETIQCQLDALKYNNEPHQDHGVEVMYRFSSFDPFERSKYFGPVFDLGQFERFRRIFHHSAYRVLLSHKERKILSSLTASSKGFGREDHARKRKKYLSLPWFRCLFSSFE